MKSTLSGFAAALLLTAGSARAERIAPFTVEKDSAGNLLLSYQLEQRFGDFMTGCGATLPLKLQKGGLFGSSTPISSIDADIVDALNLRSGRDTIRPMIGMNLVRLFGYIYATGEKDSPNRDNARFLRLDYADQSKSLAPGFSATRHEATCGSVIESALDADGQYAFPVATLKAALKGDYDRSETQSLQLVNGRFVSPIWEMWSGQTLKPNERGARRFFVSVLFWDWYRTVKPTEPQWLLTYFDGAVLYRQNTRRTTASGSASVEGRLALPFVTTNVTTRTNISSSNELGIERFEIFMAADRPAAGQTRDFQPMPSLDDVLQTAEQNTVSQIEYEGGRLLESGQAKPFFVDVEALPAALCDATGWEVRDNGTAAAASTTLTLESTSQVARDGGSACRIKMTYSPGTFTVRTDATLTPYLVSTDEYSGKRLKLRLAKVVFQRTPKPLLTHLGGDPSPLIAPIAGTTPPQYTLVWRKTFQLDDDGLYADASRIGADEIRLDCPLDTLTQGNARFVSALIGTAGPTSRTIELRGEAQYLGTLDPSSYERVACKLSGDIVFSPAGGAPPIRRAIPPAVTINYPKARPAP